MSEVQRHYYFNPAGINDIMLKGACALAINTARQKNNFITIIVNNISTSDAIEKIFGRENRTTKKLMKREIVNIDGIKVCLKSPKGISSLDELGTVLALHPAADTLKKLKVI